MRGGVDKRTGFDMMCLVLIIDSSCGGSVELGSIDIGWFGGMINVPCVGQLTSVESGH